MAISALDAANWFIRRAEADGRPMLLTTVIKLVYLAHGWSLALLQRQLVADEVQAWNIGPVYPTVYRQFRPAARSATGLPVSPFAGFAEEPEDISILEQVYRHYTRLSPSSLSNAVMGDGGAWQRSFAAGGPRKVIPDELIWLHFKALADAARSRLPQPA